MCHLGGFAGQNEIPRVAGQQHDYIVKQLSDFKQRKRTNDAGNMTSVASTLSDADIETVIGAGSNLLVRDGGVALSRAHYVTISLGAFAFLLLDCFCRRQDVVPLQWFIQFMLFK